MVVEGDAALGGVGVEQAALAAGGHRHADRVADALAERAGGRLDAGGVAVLGVARGLAAPGAQRLEVVELEAAAAEEELGVERERAWPRRARTGRGRPSRGSAGSCRITFWKSRYAAGARLIAVPGWPLPTFCTASMASTRPVSTARWSRSVQSSAGSGLSWQARGPLGARSVREVVAEPTQGAG